MHYIYIYHLVGHEKTQKYETNTLARDFLLRYSSCFIIAFKRKLQMIKTIINVMIFYVENMKKKSICPESGAKFLKCFCVLARVSIIFGVLGGKKREFCIFSEIFPSVFRFSKTFLSLFTRVFEFLSQCSRSSRQISPCEG